MITFDGNKWDAVPSIKFYDQMANVYVIERIQNRQKDQQQKHHHITMIRCTFTIPTAFLCIVTRRTFVWVTRWTSTLGIAMFTSSSAPGFPFHGELNGLDKTCTLTFVCPWAAQGKSNARISVHACMLHAFMRLSDVWWW